MQHEDLLYQPWLYAVYVHNEDTDCDEIIPLYTRRYYSDLFQHLSEKGKFTSKQTFIAIPRIFPTNRQYIYSGRYESDIRDDFKFGILEEN